MTKTNTARKPRAPRASRKMVAIPAPYEDTAPAPAPAPEPAPLEEAIQERGEALQPVTEAIDEQEGYLVRKGSVVKRQYKQAYKAGGDSRGNKDWLFAILKGATLDSQGKADIGALVEIAEENGVPSAYANRSAGWQGRMRMTIGLRLRSAVAKRGYLLLEGEKLPCPEAFRLKHAGNVVAAEIAAQEKEAAV